MTVSTKRPEYLDFEADWQTMRDCVRGTKAIKDGTTAYLPIPSGMASKGEDGLKVYSLSYKMRAQFPEITAPAIAAMVGIIHSTEIKIVLPEQLMGLWESATADNLPLEALHRRITAEILTTGRYSLLVGAESEGSELPYIVGYNAEDLINWADDRTMFVLDECGYVRDGFVWTEQQQWRALELIDGKYVQSIYDADSGLPRVVEPRARMGANMTEIPFVVIGPRDLSLEPETPPLIAIARAAISMYQLSADYRWQLFMSGQETLVIINGDAPAEVGAGVVISLKTKVDAGGTYPQPDAKYVGPEGNGIEAHRAAIQDEENKAARAGAQMFSTGPRAAESGDALRLRYAAETASLISVAQASCAGLEKALRYVGMMQGLSEQQLEEIIVTPPSSLVDRRMSPEEMKAIMGLYDAGLLAYETVYENFQKGGVASSERTAEEERQLREEEDEAMEPDIVEQGGVIPFPAPNRPPQPGEVPPANEGLGGQGA